ncbi:MAG: hypothetical protein HOO67_07800 [Candidatus Peribacteraceae bacterium]|nr:hypothetical protein [Candidatus Peribacteraceae bacterium]
MNDDLHPHWHSTPDDDGAVHPSDGACPAELAESERSGVHISVQPASRLPAAIAGIAIFTLVGVTLAGGWQAVSQALLSAQVGGPGSSASPAVAPELLAPVLIHIGAGGGFEPASVTVKPGQEIIWINDQSIPHILTSQTLRDGSGAYLNTPAIFPSSQISFIVGPKEIDRTHAVTSTTDQTLAGTVIVSTGGPAKASSSSRKAPLGNTDGVNLPSGQGSVNGGGGAKSSASAKKSSSSKQASVSGGNTSGGNVTGGNLSDPAQPAPPLIDPFQDPYANSQSGGSSTIDVFTPQDITPVNSAPNENVIAPDTPAAREQPNTGPGLWAVVLMTLAVLWGVTRKYFVRIG